MAGIDDISTGQLAAAIGVDPTTISRRSYPGEPYHAARVRRGVFSRAKLVELKVLPASFATGAAASVTPEVLREAIRAELPGALLSALVELARRLPAGDLAALSAAGAPTH